LVKPGSAGRFEVSRTGVSPILKCLKNRVAGCFYKRKSSVRPQHWDRLTILTLLGAIVVPGPHTFIQQKWFLDVLKKQALVGTAGKSLRWESIATQSSAGVVQIEDLLSQWRSQSGYQKDTSDFIAWYCHQPILDSIKIKS
jgi:hypothetical protein